MRRIVSRSVVIASVVIASIAIVLSPAAASAAPPAPPAQPAPPTPRETQEIRRLFEQPSSLILLPERPVSVEEVAAIAAAAEGLTPTDALARVSGSAPGTPEAAIAAADAVSCSGFEWTLHRGTFPYHRWIVGQTYWCYHYGADITYRASQTAARVDGVCSGSNEREWKVSGGAGYSWVVVHHEADFSCATPWWYPLNDSLWMEPAFNSYGSTSMTRNS
jgi:hypothetical protein